MVHTYTQFFHLCLSWMHFPDMMPTEIIFATCNVSLSRISKSLKLKSNEKLPFCREIASGLGYPQQVGPLGWQLVEGEGR